MQVAREARRKVSIRATMCAGGPWTDVCIRDISSRGMMVQMGAPPPRGTFVEIESAGHQIVGLVVWRKDHRFGIQTRDRINVHALVNRIAPKAVVPPRRAARHRPQAAMRSGADTSRTLGSRMEFALVAVFAAALVAALGTTAFQTLSRPFDAISTMLRP